MKMTFEERKKKAISVAEELREMAREDLEMARKYDIFRVYDITSELEWFLAEADRTLAKLRDLTEEQYEKDLKDYREAEEERLIGIYYRMADLTDEEIEAKADDDLKKDGFKPGKGWRKLREVSIEFYRAQRDEHRRRRDVARKIGADAELRQYEESQQADQTPRKRRRRRGEQTKK